MPSNITLQQLKAGLEQWPRLALESWDEVFNKHKETIREICVNCMDKEDPESAEAELQFRKEHGFGLYSINNPSPGTGLGEDPHAVHNLLELVKESIKFHIKNGRFSCGLDAGGENHPLNWLEFGTSRKGMAPRGISLRMRLEINEYINRKIIPEFRKRTIAKFKNLR